MPNTFGLRLIIERLIHSPLFHIITESRTSLLFFRNMTSGDKSTPPILLFLHFIFLNSSCIAASHYPICVVFCEPGSRRVPFRDIEPPRLAIHIMLQK